MGAQRRHKKHPGKSEAGYALTELLVTTIITGLLVVTMMPAFAGYQLDSSVRQGVQEALAQFRQAELLALGDDQRVYVLFEPTDAYQGAGWTGPGWEICIVAVCGAAGAEIVYKTVLSPQLFLSDQCYRQTLTPQGFLSDQCGGTSPVEFICLTNYASANPFVIQIKMMIATEEMIAVQATGC